MKAMRLFLFLFFCLILQSAQFNLVYSQTLKDSIYEQAYILYEKSDRLALSGSLYYLMDREDEVAYLYSDDPERLLWIYEVMANALYEFGDYTQSEYYATTALTAIDNFEQGDYSSHVTRFKCLLGILAKLERRYPIAEELYLEALNSASKTSDSLYVINNIGNLFKEQGDYETAIGWYNKGLTINSKAIEPQASQQMKLLGNLGSAQYPVYPEQGLKNLKLALAMAQELNDVRGTFSNNRHLFKYYQSVGDTLNANQHARAAVELARGINDASFLAESLGMLVDLEIATPEQAAAQMHLADSINKVNTDAANQFSYQKFNYDKVENDNLRIRADQQLLIFSIIIILLLGVGFFFRQRRISKQKQTQAVFSTEQRIASEIHDGVANDIFQTMSKIQAQDYSKEEVLEDLDAIYNDTRNISKANQGLEPDQDFTQLLTDLLGSFQSKELKVVSKDLSTMDWSDLKLEKKEALHKVLRELLVNTRKHSNATAVVVSFEKHQSHYKIHYRDNGKDATINPKGGLRHAESRIAAVQGHLKFESSPKAGVSVLIEL